MPKILISYRRADSDAIAGRIRDRLAGFYGEDSVFMDIDDIPFGIDFRKHIREALQRNDVLIVVVGPRWLGNTKGSAARIRDETDPVRVEVEMALARGIPVVPLLVHGASMPRASDLPEPLKEFAYRNAAPIDTGRDFHQHMDRLIRSVDRILIDKQAQSASGTTAEPGAASPSPKPVDPNGAPPAPNSSATPQSGPSAETASDRTTKTKKADEPIVVSPPISGELPRESPKPSISPANATPEVPPTNGSAAGPSAGEDIEGPSVQRAPTRGQAGDASEPNDGGKLSVLRGRQGLAVVVAVCAVVIGAIWVAYVLTPGAIRIQQKEQTKEETKEEPKEQTKGPPTKETTKEQAPEKLQPAQLAALACKPDTAGLFRDDFKSSRPGWDWGPLARGSKASYSDGQLVLWAPEKASIGALYTGLALKSGAVCAHVKAPHDDKTMATTGAGVIFWAQDSYNYYVASVYPDGSYGIYRYSGVSLATIAPRTRFEGVVRGLGAVNAVAVVLSNNRGTLFINDVKVQDFEGQPPSTGNAVGLWMQAQEDQPNEWRFLDIAVVEDR